MTSSKTTPQQPQVVANEVTEFTPQEIVQFSDIYNKDPFYVFHTLDGTQPQTAGNYGLFFTALFPCEVVEAAVVWQVAAAAGTLQLEKLTGTTALDSGVVLFATAVDMTGTANTVNYPILTTTRANRQMAKGDRLALKDAALGATIVGLSITIKLRPQGKGHYGF